MQVEVQRHNQTLLRNLKEGDLIEFDRGLYKHWAVYKGNEEVVHLSGEDGDGLDIQPQHFFTISGAQFEKACVRVDNFWKVAEDSIARKNNKHDGKKESYRPHDIVKRAMSKLGQIKYNIISSNCEHFANWCRYDMFKSDQVDNVATAVGVVAAVGATALAIGGLIKWLSTDDEEEERKRRQKY